MRCPTPGHLAMLRRVWARLEPVNSCLRFRKAILNWTMPRVRHPAEADRRTWFALLAYALLRLARRAIDDVHPPCEGARRLTPPASNGRRRRPSPWRPGRGAQAATAPRGPDSLRRSGLRRVVPRWTSVPRLHLRLPRP